MNIKNKKSIQLTISIMLALIISDIVKSVVGFNYHMSRDGLDFRILISFAIYILIFFCFISFLTNCFLIN